MMERHNRGFRDAKQTLLSNNRILAYCALVLIGSLLSLPDDYKVDKRNILNQWFVKIGWFWTNTLLLPLLFVSIRVDDKQGVSNVVFRIMTSTTLWYSSVNLFQIIDTATGYDISGHTFLLIFSNLIITSELKLSSLQKERIDPDQDRNSLNEAGILNTQRFTAIRFCLIILSALWDFMLLQTALYYHTILQKSIAAVWAIGSWYVLHLFFYNDIKSKAHLDTVSARGRGAR